jgi:two-component system OmpR family response regulator
MLEDNTRVVQVVESALRAAGHTVTAIDRSDGALRRLAQSHFDVVIIDIGLPDGSGLDVCRAARKEGLDVPILLLTARNDVRDRVDGLAAGADDYLGKPFAMAELLARVRALARRGPRWSESTRAYGTLVIDRDRRLVRVKSERVPLTPRELDIVELLAWRDGRAVSKDDVVESVWGESTERGAASLEVLVARIRRKLLERGVEEPIRTIRQVGYAWALPRSKAS